MELHFNKAVVNLRTMEGVRLTVRVPITILSEGARNNLLATRCSKKSALVVLFLKM